MTDKPEHTPGPWEFTTDFHELVIRTKDGDWLCTKDYERLGQGVTEEDEANFFLFAAAPDLLAALEEISSILHVTTFYEDAASKGLAPDLVKVVRRVSNAALKRAKRPAI